MMDLATAHRSRLSTCSRYLGALLLIAACISSPLSASASINYWQEKKQAQQLIKLLPQEQIRWLPGSPPSLALYLPSHVLRPKGTAIILGTTGEHPDQQPIINKLRHSLPNHGWSTLSVHMPVINEAEHGDLLQLYDATKPRLDEAINLIFNENPPQELIFIGHGFGASVMVHYLRNHPELFARQRATVKGAVLISLPGRESSDNWLDSSKQLEELTLPILDIYAEYDRLDVIGSAEARLRAAHIAGRKLGRQVDSPNTNKVRQLAINKTGNPLYRQHQINAAQNRFPSQNGFLIKAIRSWLAENPQ